MTNKKIARLLRETADLIKLAGGNQYRARAFANASRQIDRLETPVTQHAQEDTLTSIPGVGQGMADEIRELLEQGALAARRELLNELPPELPDLLQVQGLGPKKARRLWLEASITSLDQLEQQAKSGALTRLKGFGQKTQQNVLENVRRLKRYKKRRRYAEAISQVEPLLTALRAEEAITRAELAGALRRKLETVERAQLIVTAEEAKPVHNALRGVLNEDAPRPDGDDLVFEGTLPDGLPLEARLVPESRFGTTWWLLTGSEAHCRAFREQYGEPEAHADEADVYAEADLPCIEPELREGRGELEAAAADRLPALITEENLRGTLHNHSTYSDGANTLHEMAEAAREMGLSYFGICDHSRSLSIANGLSIERVREQQEEIRRLNESYGSDFRIFSGIECDILDDGSLDYPDEVLATFDFVVASVHTGFNMTEEEATERVRRAIANPYTTILGHATGRLLLKRKGYSLNAKRVITACAEHDVAIELNANPYRLDMDWRHLRNATDQGVLVSINPDAHSIQELHHVRWGIAVARKGWLTPDQCLNAKSLDAFAEWLAAHQPTT